MRRLALLALIAPLAAGCNWFGGGWSSYPPSGPAIYKSSGTVHTATVVAVPARGGVRRWIEAEHLPPAAIPGARLFAASGCLSCHVYAGAGTSNLGAPPLTAIGTRHLGISFEIRHLTCPSCVNPGSPMPSFRFLGGRRLRRLAIFLEASKGTH